MLRGVIFNLGSQSLTLLIDKADVKIESQRRARPIGGKIIPCDKVEVGF